MKIFAALAFAAVNAQSETVTCWTGEGESIAEFTANAVSFECGKNELCQMTVRKRGGDIEKVMGSCKQDQACNNNAKQNFSGGKQCRPEETEDRNGAKVVSVCRSCSDLPTEQLNSASFSTDAEWKTNLLL